MPLLVRGAAYRRPRRWPCACAGRAVAVALAARGAPATHSRMRAALAIMLLCVGALAVAAAGSPSHAHDGGDEEGAAGPALLAAPTHLLVDLTEAQAPPLLLIVGTPRPTFSFVAPGDLGANRSMTDYQIVVRDSAGGAVRWDSGRVTARGALAEGVLCGAALQPGRSYSWTVQYWAASLRSEPAASTFDIGLLSEADWAGAKWLGGGQKQFKLAPPSSALSSLRRAPGTGKIKLHVAAPGGAVVEVGGDTLGDPVGLSLWTTNDKTTQYFSYDVTEALLDGDARTDSDIVVTIGGGFFSSTVRPAKASNGARPTMCRILLLLDTGATGAESNDEGGRVLLRSAVQGRTGPILADDPWMGTTTNTSLARSDGWAAAKLADEEDIPLGQLVPVPMPAATKRGNLQAGKTKRLFDFPQLV